MQQLKKINKPRLRRWVCHLRYYREAKGLSIGDLASETGISGSTIFEIEKGVDVKLSTALLLTAYFKLEIGELWEPIAI